MQMAMARAVRMRYGAALAHLAHVMLQLAADMAEQATREREAEQQPEGGTPPAAGTAAGSTGGTRDHELELLAVEVLLRGLLPFLCKYSLLTQHGMCIE